MPDPLSQADLLAKALSVSAELGVPAKSGETGTLTGQQEAILAKWFLGGRKVVYRFSCRFEASTHDVRFREAVVESSWGVPPLTLTVEKTSQSGTRVSQARTDKGVGGGGTLDYGRLRDAIEKAVGDAGWQFVFEAGRVP